MGLNLLLIPRMGLLGGGIASLISYVAGFAYQLLASCRGSGRWPDSRNALTVIVYALLAYATAVAVANLVPSYLPVIAVLVSTVAATTVFAGLALLRPPRGFRGLQAVIVSLRTRSDTDASSR